MDSFIYLKMAVMEVFRCNGNLLFLELLETIEKHYSRVPRVIVQTRLDAFELNDDYFKRMFRMPKELVMELIADLRPLLPRQTRRSALSVEDRVLTALRFFALGSYQLKIGNDSVVSLSQRSVSRCIESVAQAMSNLLPKWVYFPTKEDEYEQLKQQFYEKFSFPGVIGAIDCTHVVIVCPPKDDPEHPEAAYLNHKGYHSLNVQLICDASMKILNVESHFPGSLDNCTTWKNSEARSTFLENFQRNQNQGYWLLGDSCYPLEPWLLTPLVEEAESTVAEQRYNRQHAKARSVIEQCIRLLKNRWRCLMQRRVLHYHPLKASVIINACVILHNMCVMNNVPAIEEIQEWEDKDGTSSATGSEELTEQDDLFLFKARQIQYHLLKASFA